MKGFHITFVKYLLFLIVLVVSVSHSKLVKYVFEVDYAAGSPDGVRNPWVLKINKQFPGPTIYADVGDTLQIDVYNKIKDHQNTSIHWHGIHQNGSPFEDGPSMITQCPIRYGNIQRYQFKVEQWGTYWYHAHLKSQYSEGLWGSMIIRNKKELYSYDHEMLITLADWYHTRAKDNEEWYLSPENKRGLPPFPDSLLLNGRGRFPCDKLRKLGRNLTCQASQQRRNVFTVPKGKRVRVRVVNPSSRTTFMFSIDQHILQAIEVDGIDVAEPVITNVVEIGPGQRYSFLLSTNHKTGDRFLIRAGSNLQPPPDPDTPQGKCPDCTFNEVSAVMEYDRRPSAGKKPIKIKLERHDYTAVVPSKPDEPQIPLEETQLLPHDKIEPPPNSDVTILLDAKFTRKPDGTGRFTFNDTIFHLPQDKPLLHQVIEGNSSSSIPQHFPYLTVPYLSTVKIIINNFGALHPFHMHGHHFWVVGKFPMRRDREGKPLPYDDKLDGWKVNYAAPKRDTVLTPRDWVVVIVFYTDNPGVWNFHCHIDWHNLGGMSFIINEAPDITRELFEVSEEMKLMCKG